MSNKSIQQDLLNGLKEIYKDAEAKKIDKDNFLDIFIPSINPAKGTHLFFNTSKGVIKIGYYVRDENFINAIVENASSSIEAASNGLRVLGNPEFKNVKDALIAAQNFLSAFSSSNVKKGKVAKPDSILKKPLNKTKTSEETKKPTKRDIIDEFNNAVKAFKDLNMEAVAEYVQAGNPVLQFSNDNGVIDNFLISMTSGGNLNKEKLDLYIKKGLDLNATTSDDDAYTACHFAAWDGNNVVLKMLIDAGANPDIIGGDTMTALNLASANGHMECVEILVSSDVNIDNRITNDNIYHSTKGGTALRDAVINSFWDLADFLIKSGASVDILNEKCANGEDFFTAVRKIISGLENKDKNLAKLADLEKICTKTVKKSKPSKSTELAPHDNDEVTIQSLKVGDKLVAIMFIKTANINFWIGDNKETYIKEIFYSEEHEKYILTTADKKGNIIDYLDLVVLNTQLKDEYQIDIPDNDANLKKTAKKAVPKVNSKIKEDEEDEVEEEDVEEEEYEEEDVDQTDSDILNFESNADKFYKKELNRFLQIAERTGILTNDIVSEPTIKERDELWDITRVFLDRVYSLDNDPYLNEYEVNTLCFYSIVALHWCDIYVTDKRFSFENGRFRRDTIALVLCLSTRISYTFEKYDLMHNGFVKPHMYFSALLWTIRTIIIKKEDVFFNKYSVSDAEKALQLFMSIDKKNQERGSSGFIEMKQVPDGHPLLNIWLDLIKLFINERPPYKFVLNYISHGSNNSTIGLIKGLFGGNKSNSGESITLIPKDLESNIRFLNNRIETISFEDSWPFTNDLMFTAHHMILLQNKTIPKEVLNSILTKTSEWVPDLDLKEVQKNYKNVVKEFDKNHSDIRVKFILSKMYKYMTLQNPNDSDERNTQLRLVIGDLVEIAKSDTQHLNNHFEFISAINNYWGGVIANKDEDETDESNNEIGLPELECTASEAKIIKPFLQESINYNGVDNVETRLPKWIKSVLSQTVLTSDQIDILTEQIKKNKAIPLLKYAPKECFNFVKNVWWIAPVVIWKEDVLSLIVVDKNGFYSLTDSETTEMSLISPFDRVTEYTLDQIEPTIERLTLIFDNGAFQTFDFFIEEGSNGYLSVIAAILDIRITTINKSKNSSGWKEGAGGEGFIEFDNITQLYDLKYWKKKEISRPDPRFFG